MPGISDVVEGRRAAWGRRRRRAVPQGPSPAFDDGIGPVGPPRRRQAVHPAAITVLVVALALVAGLTVMSELSYRRNEQRLTGLQTKLTGVVLSEAFGQVQAILSRVAGLAAEAPAPTAVFRQSIAPYMAPKGPFASSALVSVDSGGARVLAHLGAPSIRSLTSPSSISLFKAAARTPALTTTRSVKAPIQRLAYLVSARGRGATYVVGVSQQVPDPSRPVPVRAGSPDANLNFALYFGRSTTRAALIEADVARLPLGSTDSRTTVPFGNNVLTLVASPRTSLAGPTAEYTPWGILAAGVLISLAAAALTERLVRRRRWAEQVAAVNRDSYERQRDLSVRLQQSLLPKTLPAVPGLELTARYLPSARGTEIGGDWYSIVAVGGRCLFVIGDVSGHGIDTAGTMAALRYSTRTLARLGLSPAEILDRADEEFDMGDGDRFATALAGMADPERGELTLASAGHPAPLLLQADGEARYLSVPLGLPLGLHGQPRQAVTVNFDPGSTLIAFTDGLVERRGEHLDHGLTRLARAASAPASPVTLLDDILAATAPSDHEDDIAVIAVSFVGEPRMAAPHI